MKYLSLFFLTMFSALGAIAQTSVADGDWGDNATWGGAAPGYEGLGDITIDSYVISDFPLTFADNHRKLTVLDTLIVYGDVTFTANSGAAIEIGPGNILIIFGNLNMGKNHAGIEIGAGGMLIVTGNISSTGTGGGITGEGTVYTDGNTTGMEGGNTGGEHPIDQINEEEGDEKSPIEEFVVGGGSTPLPVELLYFEAKRSDGILLSWSTATEKNNKRFEIHRSEDGVYFYQIGEQKGAGNSKNQVNYTYQDREFFTAVAFYRLRQVDYDGAFEYSKTIRVETAIDHLPGQYSLYPTIVTGNDIKLRGNKPFRIREVSIYDLRGSLHETTLDSTGGHSSAYSISTSSLTKGTYILRALTTEGEEVIRRFFVK